MRFFRLLAVCSFVLAPSLEAQTLTLSGQVKDQNGLEVPAATVIAKSAAGASKSTETNQNGHYRLDGLASGAYKVDVIKGGFQIASKTVNLTQSAVETFTLEILPQATSVTVEATVGRTTASRMDVPASELPVQVSTIQPYVLIEQAPNDLVSALRNASGVNAMLWYGTYEYYTVRGFNIQDVQLVDGLRMEGNRINTQLNNVEQIDVLKGPSSVLYGGQALGGAINIVRKKPQGVRAYDAVVRAGRFKTFQVGGGITGPIFGSEKWLYRADASFADAEGWRGAGSRRLNVTPSLTWIPNSNHRVTVHQAINRDDFDTDAGVRVEHLALPNFDLSRRLNTPQDRSLVRDSQTQVLYNWTINPAWEFRNSYQYRWTTDNYFSAEGLSLVPGSPTLVNREFLYFKHNRRPHLNQADFVGRFELLGMKHRFLAGWEYQDFYNFTIRSASRSVRTSPIDVLNPVETHQTVTSFPTSRIDYFTNGVNAFFWQDHVKLAKRLALQIGGRYDIYRRSAHNDPVNAAGEVTRTPDLKRNQEAYTYRAGLVYDLTESQDLYFASASSFQPVTTIPADGRELNPETGRSYEIGHRWRALGSRLNFSTALYKIERQNVVIGTGPGRFEQAGQQSSRGVDFDVNGNVGKGIRLIANYGYTQPKFDAFCISNCTVSLAGRLPRFIQKHAANVWATKNWNNGVGVSLGTRYLGPMFTDNTNIYRLGGWTTWSSRVSYARPRYELAVNFENMFNRGRYFLAGINDNQLYPGSPINVFTTLRLRFK